MLACSFENPRKNLVVRVPDVLLAMDSAATLADEASDKLTMETGMKNYATPFKPGRKFGLTGQRQQQQQVFNTLTNSTSSSDGRRMSVRDEQRNSWMYSLSEQEMEDKYNAICLAIRTENLTLGQRLEHQHAERDLVENNLSQEVKVLHSLFLVSLHYFLPSCIEFLLVVVSSSGCMHVRV